MAGRLFPLMSFVVLGFGIAMAANGDIGYDQFWIVFGLIAWAFSAATGILFPRSGGEAAGTSRPPSTGPVARRCSARLRRISARRVRTVALMFLIVFDMVVKPFS